MIKQTTTPSQPQRPELTLKESYRLLRRLPLGSSSDLELEQISDQISSINNRTQIATLLAHLERS